MAASTPTPSLALILLELLELLSVRRSILENHRHSNMRQDQF